MKINKEDQWSGDEEEDPRPNDSSLGLTTSGAWGNVTDIGGADEEETLIDSSVLERTQDLEN